MSKNLIHKAVAVATAIIMLSGTIISVSAKAYNPDNEYKNLSVKVIDDKKPDVGFYIDATEKFLLDTVKEPSFGTSAGEWTVMDILRGMYSGSDYINKIPQGYFEGYIKKAEAEMISKKGTPSSSKYTEYSRLILALSALGYDVNNVAPHYRDSDGNVVTKDTQGARLVSYDIPLRYSVKNSQIYRQGINGPIWCLIAMNTGNYKFYTKEQLESGINGTDSVISDKLNAFGVTAIESEAQLKGVATEGKQIEYILSEEITQADGTKGGWALFGTKPDPDITSMALQALAPYYLSEDKFETARNNAYYDDNFKFECSYEDFKKVVERAVLVLSKIQHNNGGYDSWGTVNAESISQVIVALTELKINPISDKVYLPALKQYCSFIKSGEEVDGVTTNNMIDCLLTFWQPVLSSDEVIGGFKHINSGNDGGGGSGTSINGMATDQALYALISYDRYIKNEKSLYDMTDMVNGQYKFMKAKTYTLTYNNQGKAENTSEKFSPYQTVNLKSGSKIDNYTFEGWNTKSDGSGTSYMAGDKLSMPSENVTVYAVYTLDSEINAKINDVILKINDIGKISLASKDKISIARNAYNELPESIKKEIKNYDILLKAEKEYEYIYSENQKAYAINKRINSIGVVTLSKEKLIADLRKDYDALSDTAKAMVTDYEMLVKAEKAIEKLIIKDKSGVVILIDTTVVPENTTMTVDVINNKSDTTYDKIKKALESVGDKFIAYNIDLYSNNVKIEPNGSLTVKLPLPDGYNKDIVKVIKILDNGNIKEYACTVENGFVIFKADSFSVYAIVETSEKNNTSFDSYENNTTVDNPKTENSFAFIPMIAIITCLSGLCIIRKRAISKK